MNSSQVVAVEIEKVRDKVPTLFEREDTFYSTIEKRDVEVMSTRDMRVPLELRPGGAFGAADIDGGDLGRGDGPTYDKATVNTISSKFACEWTAKSEWGNDDSRKAVLKTFRRLLSTAMAEYRRHLDASIVSGGGNGVLATVTSVTTASGVDTVTCTTDGFGVKALRFGQKVKIYDSTLATDRTATGGSKISFIDYPNKQFKFTSVSGITGGDLVVVDGVSGASPSWFQGIAYHHNSASTGTWLGFDRALTPEIRANRVNASSTSLALPFPRLALNKIGDRIGMDNVKKATAWMHPCQKQAYEELGQLVSLIHKEPKDEALDLYFGDSMQMAGAPVKDHYMWDKTRIDFVVADVWGRAEMHPAGFYESDGRKVFEARGTSGGVATSSMFYLVSSFNPFVSNPAACAYIDGLTVPTGY